MRSKNSDEASELVRRLDSFAGAMNVVLVVLAVGLATLDATCFLAMHLENAVAYTGVTTVSVPPATINELVR
ncbi:MAG TPA: hypothetical protein VMU69_20585 [Bradyrhizobium sp.]|nr:hypothetical protein [Stellaceae bacterium]HUN98617.1 hypothetical protein [Bradyrhizobium sp.]